VFKILWNDIVGTKQEWLAVFAVFLMIAICGVPVVAVLAAVSWLTGVPLEASALLFLAVLAVGAWMYSAWERHRETSNKH
jgi:membrane protein implicated in regulation of membrane protease activity